MELKPLRAALIATTVVSLAMASAAAGWALLSGPSEMPDLKPPVWDTSPEMIASSSGATDAKAFEELWSLKLQGSAKLNRTVEKTGPSVAKSPQFAIKLVGTFIEPSRALAMFRDGAGVWDIKGVGEPLELSPAGVQVEKIESGLATLRYAGRMIQLELEDVLPLPPNPSDNGDNGDEAAVAPMIGQGASEMQSAGTKASGNPSPKSSIDVDDPLDWLPSNMNVYGAKQPPEPSTEGQP